MSTLLNVDDLRVKLFTRSRTLTIVSGVDFAVAEGEIVGIAGESGSGKSVSALSVIGLQPATMRVSGRVTFQEKELVTARPRTLRTIRGRDIGVVFQDSLASLHPMLTVERQLAEPLRRHLGLSRAEARRRVEGLLERVRIPDRRGSLKRYPHEFSGGMRQRIAIAMALACNPKLLIADEPTTALDVTVQAGILRLLDDLRRDSGLAVLLITHDIGVLSAVADRLYVFYGGRVVESGSTRELVSEPRHPYTKALLDSVPRHGGSNSSSKGIPGAAPTPGSFAVDACVFEPRCGYASNVCLREEPKMVSIGQGRTLRCAVDPFEAER